MVSFKLSGFLFVVFVCFLFCWPSSVLAAENDGTIFENIDESEILLGQAYQAILGVEELDIDVSELLYTFNNATEILTKAQLAFDVENFNDAKTYTKSVTEICKSIIDDVEKMKIDAVGSQAHELMMISLVSALGVFVVVVVSTLIYWTFKKRYFTNIWNSN